MAGDPKSAPPFVQETAAVLAHEPVSSRYFRLRLKSPQVALRAQPGQFVMLACMPDAPLASDPLLPRPLAILDADPQAGTFELLYFVAGRGTELLRRTAEGKAARLRVIGPLGKGFFPLPGVDAHIGVGGGSGVAPLVFFFRRWRGGSAEERHLILAARSKAQLARPESVAAPGVRLHEATDDGSTGFKGHAVAALSALLDGPLQGRRVALYVAGPEPMLESAAKLARERNLPCRVSLEARMACGVGVCRSCVVDGLVPHLKTGLLRRTICQDGPVFNPCDLAGDGFAGKR